MSSTRRANKRERIQRRAENQTIREARREALFVVLSRAQRGRLLSVDEGALLRTAVEAEIREGDAARTSERGQQRAMEEHRQRVEAADDAIRELEQRALDAEEQLTAYRSVLGPRPLDRIREAETRAAQAEHQIRILTAVDEGRAHGARRIMDERDQAQQRADQAEELLSAAHQCSNDAEKARANAEQRAEQAEEFAKFAEAAATSSEAAAEDYRRHLASALGRSAGASWPDLIEHAAEAHQWAARAAVRADRQRAERAEERLTRIRDMADAWEQRLPATIRTATAAEAVRNAANGNDKPVMFGMADAPAIDWQARAVRAEMVLSKVLAAKTWSEVHTELGMFYRMKPEEAGTRARERRTAAERAAEARAAQAEALAAEQQRRADHRGAQLADALHRAARYRLAWLACRRDRKADRAAMAAELPLIVGPPRRAPEVITDRATIRNALDEHLDAVRRTRP
ncbi:hypothetical protein [Streptomyces sp. NPDC016675]|uniref:hypothetical protein n=1 Tax=Streptomyces sp. NPDC016675 TaxID=3364970 RepID=UPI003701EDCB